MSAGAKHAQNTHERARTRGTPSSWASSRVSFFPSFVFFCLPFLFSFSLFLLFFLSSTSSSSSSSPIILVVLLLLLFLPLLLPLLLLGFSRLGFSREGRGGGRDERGETREARRETGSPGIRQIHLSSCFFLPAFSPPFLLLSLLLLLLLLLLESHCPHHHHIIPPLSSADADMTDMVLTEMAKFCENELSPLNETADREGCTWVNEHEVKTPTGFKAAYDQWVEGGWQGLNYPEEYGRQGLPYSLAMVRNKVYQHPHNKVYQHPYPRINRVSQRAAFRWLAFGVLCGSIFYLFFLLLIFVSQTTHSRSHAHTSPSHTARTRLPTADCRLPTADRSRPRWRPRPTGPGPCTPG